MSRRILLVAVAALFVLPGIVVVAQETDDVEALTTYGASIALEVPGSIRRAMRDQGTAIARLRLQFRDNQSSKDGVALEFEGMRTEVPVIYAAFEPERCDRTLTYDDWNDRDGHYVDLGFEVKTRPRNLSGLRVQIEHRHMRGEHERLLMTVEAPQPEPGEPWESLRVRGALPGINRYTLVVSYTDSQGNTSTQRGFSHWVLVSSPPMFAFRHDVQAVATRLDAGEVTALYGEITFTGRFQLHDGLDPGDCTLRVARRGRRDSNRNRLPSQIRRAVEQDAPPPGWQELGRYDLKAGDTQGALSIMVEDNGIRIELKHGIAASSTVLPLAEDWEYSLELIHRPSRQVLAQWSAQVDMNLARLQDLEQAAIRVRATGLREPLIVPFARR